MNSRNSRQRNQRAVLAAEVAQQQVEVDSPAGGLGRPGIVLAIEIGELAAEEVGPLGPVHHVEEHVFPAADQRGPLPDVGETVEQGVGVQAAALVRQPE